MESVNESLTAERYRVFSQIDAQDLSTLYSSLATSIAADPDLLERIDSLPPSKRHAGFVFAAARFHDIELNDYASFRRGALERWDDIAETARTRTLQTNDPARLLATLPLLAQIDGPIALLEVGASAGLCLNVDRYSYRFGEDDWVHPVDGPSTVALTAKVSGPLPVPTRMPDIRWRAGIELNPLDIDDPDDERWLSALLWPDNEERGQNLRAAVEVLRRHPVRIVEGDLNDRLAELVREVPDSLTLVIMHSAVLPYVPQDEAEHFVRTVRGLDAVWISNELADVVPQVAMPRVSSTAFSFVVARDGVPVAHAHPHGVWVRWHGSSARSDVGVAS